MLSLMDNTVLRLLADKVRLSERVQFTGIEEVTPRAWVELTSLNIIMN